MYFLNGESPRDQVLSGTAALSDQSSTEIQEPLTCAQAGMERLKLLNSSLDPVTPMLDSVNRLICPDTFPLIQVYSRQACIL